MKSFADRLRPDTCAIFLLHGVTHVSDCEVRNYTRKHLPASDFEAFLDGLENAGGQAISLDRFLAAGARGEKLPPRSYVLTFDDGFENNYSVAAPILDSRGLPATFYVSTKLIDENAMSWIDRIELCLEAAGNRPGLVLSLQLAGRPIAVGATGEKIEALKFLRATVKADASIDTDALADEIFRQCGMSPVHASSHPLDQKMSWKQVGELHAHSLFSVGGHSHTHVNLAFLPQAEMVREIDLSLCLLAEKGGVKTRHYSYPEGLAHCYSQAVIDTLKQRGIECSPTAIDGVNVAGEDPFHLRRVMVE